MRSAARSVAGEPAAVMQHYLAWGRVMLHAAPTTGAPVHASRLKRVEIDFSAVQRKVLTPNHSVSTDQFADRLLRFERHYERVARSSHVRTFASS